MWRSWGIPNVKSGTHIIDMSVCLPCQLDLSNHQSHPGLIKDSAPQSDKFLLNWKIQPGPIALYYDVLRTTIGIPRPPQKNTVAMNNIHHFQMIFPLKFSKPPPWKPCLDRSPARRHHFYAGPDTHSQARDMCSLKLLALEQYLSIAIHIDHPSIQYMEVSWNRGTPKSSICRWIFH